MAIHFDATPSSQAANSYLTLDEANTYFEGRFGADLWMTFTDDQKMQLILTSTKVLDNCLFGGLKTDPTQPLNWPRKNLFNRDGRLIDRASIPAKMKEATCEYAYWVWTEEDRLLSDVEIQQVDSVNLGPLDIKVNAKKIFFPLKVEQLMAAIGPGVLLRSVADRGITKNQVRMSR